MNMLHSATEPAGDGFLQKYGARNVPRYTSYPTAPHFHARIGVEEYKRWLGRLRADQSLSLYLHVPFCDALCWYCGCAAQVARKYGPVAEYVKVLVREIDAVTDAMSATGAVRHMHWGGGSPNRLNAEDFSMLMSLLKERFTVAEDAEIAIEIDPRTLSDEQIAAYAASGVNRASLGLQDFTPKVQQAINREQSFDLVKNRVEALRAGGIEDLNFDLMYGLPHQTVADAERSVELALSLNPSRFAVFGYAHVPWMRKHQNLIPSEALPGAPRRHAQSERMARRIRAAGYVEIGLDHYARPDDPMAIAASKGDLKRNFQGYTVDRADALIGFGASSIGSLPDGYIQNIADTRRYEESVRETGFAVARGYELTRSDRLQRRIIEEIMCAHGADLERACAEADADIDQVVADSELFQELMTDGLVTWDGKKLRMTKEGLPYVRVVAACFDAFLSAGRAQHSGAV